LAADQLHDRLREAFPAVSHGRTEDFRIGVCGFDPLRHAFE
jgi:hypothetical protein